MVSVIEGEVERWKCKRCLYVYNPTEQGDILFQELPRGWKCPRCGSNKIHFEPVQGREF